MVLFVVFFSFALPSCCLIGLSFSLGEFRILLWLESFGVVLSYCWSGLCRGPLACFAGGFFS